MGEKLTARSSARDRHGDHTGLKELQDYVQVINGMSKMRYLANHRRDLPPVGFMDNAEILEQGEVYHALVEPICFSNRAELEWGENLISEDAGKPLKLIRRDFEVFEYVRIAMDKNNFSSIEQFEATGQQLAKIFDQELKFQGNTRKSFLPDPQIVITLTGYYTIIYPLLKPILSKIGEKIGDEIADSLYELAKKRSKNLFASIVDSIKLARNRMIPQNRILSVIFEIPGTPYIELHIKSDDPNRILKAISEKQIFKIHKKVKELQSRIDITEICFVLNAKNKWDFTYLLSKDGKIIGTKSAFKKRDKLVERINLSPTKALSIGADSVEYARRPKKA